MIDPLFFPNADVDSAQTTSFSDRLKFLLQDDSVSAFARKVGLSESLIRKYLKGSEPSLSRAEQIARLTNVSLQWLASGRGQPFRDAELVDKDVLQQADKLVSQALTIYVLHLPDVERMALVVSAYQFLQTNTSNGMLDEQGAQLFISHKVANLRAK